MQYLVMEKICENACKLVFMGESFNDASEYVECSNRNNDKVVYIITGLQMHDIFFNGCSQKCVNKYLKENHKYDKDGNPYLYMPLLVSFEMHDILFK